MFIWSNWIKINWKKRSLPISCPSILFHFTISLSSALTFTVSVLYWLHFEFRSVSLTCTFIYSVTGFLALKYCHYLYFNHYVVFRRSHTVELLLAGQRLLLLFPMAQDRSSFLGELSQRRSSLEGLKMVALPLPCTPSPHQGQHTQGEDQLPAYTLSPYSSWWFNVVWPLLVSSARCLILLVVVFSGRNRSKDQCSCTSTGKSHSTSRYTSV